MIDRSTLTAFAWAATNLALTRAVVESRPFPWLAMIGFVFAPLLFIFFAERIASRLQRGWMERWASDYREPQSPAVITLIGWLLLAVQTTFLVIRMASDKS